ncbi:MAG: hypothetical protein ACK5CA_09355 [Cyanobacteriota bacterium]|jgi:hypothetical protein
MKSRFFGLVAVCLIAILSLTLFVQSPALAREGDEMRNSSRFSSWVTRPTTRPGTGSPSVENVTDALQGDVTGLFKFDRTGDGADIKPSKTDSQRDRERRDTVKEVTGKRHIAGGGPQEN